MHAFLFSVEHDEEYYFCIHLFTVHSVGSNIVVDQLSLHQTVPSKHSLCVSQKKESHTGMELHKDGDNISF